MRGAGRVRRRLAASVAVVAIGVLAAPLFRAPPPRPYTVPADGAVLRAAPGTVVLGIAEAADPRDMHVSVMDGADRPVTTGDAVMDGRRIRLPLRPLPDGGYRIVYHLVLSDRRELSGSTAFRVDGAGRTGPTDTPAGGGHRHGGSVDPLTAVALAANVVVLVAIAVGEALRWWRSRRRKLYGVQEAVKSGTRD